MQPKFTNPLVLMIENTANYTKPNYTLFGIDDKPDPDVRVFGVNNNMLYSYEDVRNAINQKSFFVEEIYMYCNGGNSSGIYGMLIYSEELEDKNVYLKFLPAIISNEMSTKFILNKSLNKNSRFVLEYLYPNTRITMQFLLNKESSKDF